MIRSPATNWKRFPASMIFKIETINQTNLIIKLELFMDDSRLKKTDTIEIYYMMIYLQKSND